MLHVIWKDAGPWGLIMFLLGIIVLVVYVTAVAVEVSELIKRKIHERRHQKNIHAKAAVRHYESIPAKLLEKVFHNPGCRIVKDTIDVEVMDDNRPFSAEDWFSIQRVTIKFEWCGLTKEGKEIKFDKQFKEAGYFPEEL